MSYTPTQWATGDTVTAEKLNKMENGIAAATKLVINYPYASITTVGSVTIDTGLTPEDLCGAIIKSSAGNVYIVTHVSKDYNLFGPDLGMNTSYKYDPSTGVLSVTSYGGGGN